MRQAFLSGASGWHIRPVGLLLALTLSGCATYRPLPLPRRPDLLPAFAAPSAPATTPAEWLDLGDLARFAVDHNPGLRAQRVALGVPRAELYAAGLLPDPQLSIGGEHPTTRAPGLINAGIVGLGYDLGALLTRGTTREAARQNLAQARLDLAWSEWQTAQQARTLGLAIWTAQRKRAVLEDALARYRHRQAQSSAALKAGDATLLQAGPDLTALLDATGKLAQLEQTASDDAPRLRALLGIDPRAPLVSVGPSTAEAAASELLAPAAAQAELAGVAQRRPDLRALAAGYAAQEARLRGSVLAQLPAITLGLARGRDTSAVYTNGLNLSLSLPLFSGARGAIASDRATRRQLRAEYQARLDQTTADVAQLLDTAAIGAAQRTQLEQHLPALQAMVRQARGAYARGDMDALAYLNLEQTLTDQRLERIDLTDRLLAARIALDTLLALPLPRDAP
jgi:outer membrane protein TolC